MIFEIKHKFSFKILFSGEFKSIKDCLVTADLQGANLRDADLQGANLRDADLRDADLRDADLRDADLQGADLRCADLRCANLRCADLRCANLQGADLRCADLRDADLQDANLQGADLRGADLRCANLDFSCLHLACKTFNVKWSDKHIFQFIAHITRSNVENLSDNAREAILALDKWKNDFCNYRTDIKKI